jgi:hypothetical protein
MLNATLVLESAGASACSTCGRESWFSSAVSVAVDVSRIPSNGSSTSKVKTGRAGRRRTHPGTDVMILVVVMDRNRSLRTSFGDWEELWAAGRLADS